MGWRDLSCYGNEVFETPNLDKLARQGMRFTNAYAACPICGPSRAAIMTGKFPSTSGYVDNFVSETKGGILQRTQERSHLELLHKHNIDAGMFGNSVADLGLLKS